MREVIASIGTVLFVVLNVVVVFLVYWYITDVRKANYDEVKFEICMRPTSTATYDTLLKTCCAEHPNTKACKTLKGE